MDPKSLKDRIEAAKDRAWEFNEHPPKWAYVVIFIVLLFVFQGLRHIYRGPL